MAPPGAPAWLQHQRDYGHSDVVIPYVEGHVDHSKVRAILSSTSLAHVCQNGLLFFVALELLIYQLLRAGHLCLQLFEA